MRDGNIPENPSKTAPLSCVSKIHTTLARQPCICRKCCQKTFLKGYLLYNLFKFLAFN